jgi:hypothetical protein
MPNMNIFYGEDIKVSINTWLTVEDQVIISTSVMYSISYVFKLSTMNDLIC